MNEFLTNALTFPTMVFSILLGFCVVYWMFAAFGVFDVTEGWAVDADVGDFVDAHAHHPGDTTHGGHGLAAILARFGLGGVPFMVMLTVLSLTAWIASYFLQMLVLSHFPDLVRWVVGLGVIAAALVGGVFATSLMLRPVRWAVARFGPEPPKPVLGRVGEVISPQVDDRGGRVQVEDGGAGLIFQVRTSSGVVYPRGAKVVLLSVDENHVYEVISQSEFDRQ